MTLKTDRAPDAPPPVDVVEGPVVLVLADDLIWSTRLTASLRAAGARPVVTRTAEAFAEALPNADRVVVDLTARAYDGVAQVAVATAGGRPVLAVGQHDDAELRRRAIAAGAERVHPYRLLFEAGPRVLERWLATTEAVR